MKRPDHDPEPDPELERMAEATADLAPSDELTAAVMAAVARDDEGLERLAEATAELAPGADFVAAVMATIERDGGGVASQLPPASGRGVLADVVRQGRWAIAGALAVAAACAALSLRAERDFDDAAASVDLQELTE
jgi:hypothetical protein